MFDVYIRAYHVNTTELLAINLTQKLEVARRSLLRTNPVYGLLIKRIVLHMAHKPSAPFPSTTPTATHTVIIIWHPLEIFPSPSDNTHALGEKRRRYDRSHLATAALHQATFK